MMRTHHKGFTATELLIVLALLTVIFLLLVPAINTQHVKRYRTLCAQNLQIIGAGMLAYASDHGGCFPTVRENRSGLLWDEALVVRRYVPRESVFQCPADRMERDGHQPVRSYSFADAIPASKRYWIQGSRLPCRFFLNRAEVALVVEQVSSCNAFGKMGAAEAWTTTDVKSQHQVKRRTETHEAANYLFLDGHVAWFEKPQTNWFPKPPPGAPEQPCP